MDGIFYLCSKPFTRRPNVILCSWPNFLSLYPPSSPAQPPPHKCTTAQSSIAIVLFQDLFLETQRTAAIFQRSYFLTSPHIETLAYSPTVCIRHLKTNAGVGCSQKMFIIVMDLIRCLLYLVDVFIWAGPVHIPDPLTLS